jgi:hypothetical protein
MRSGSPLEGLPHGVTHVLYPSQTFPVRLPRMKKTDRHTLPDDCRVLGSAGVSETTISPDVKIG